MWNGLSHVKEAPEEVKWGKTLGTNVTECQDEQAEKGKWCVKDQKEFVEELLGVFEVEAFPDYTKGLHLLSILICFKIDYIRPFLIAAFVIS